MRSRRRATRVQMAFTTETKRVLARRVHRFTNRLGIGPGAHLGAAHRVEASSKLLANHRRASSVATTSLLRTPVPVKHARLERFLPRESPSLSSLPPWLTVVCSLGHYRDKQDCKMCPEDTYAEHGTCVSCPLMKISPAGSTSVNDCRPAPTGLHGRRSALARIGVCRQGLTACMLTNDTWEWSVAGSRTFIQ